MSKFRRLYVPGGTYFFTVVTSRRMPMFADEANVVRLRTAFRRTLATRPFRIVAACVLPDHLHCIWTLPGGDDGFPARWRSIKTHFTRSLAAGRTRDSRRSPWQPRYWEHVIRDDADLCRLLDYTHYNPVKHGLVTRPVDWPHTSLHRFIAGGMYPSNWGEHPPPGIDALQLE